MKDYIICTDSACDIRADVLKAWKVPCMNLTFKFDGDDREYTESDIAIKDFYNKMRSGAVVKTAAINPDTFKSAFEAILKEGKNVLYLGFSSGLSTTFNSARIASEELSESYPDRKIIVVDTLCASAGQGLILYLALKKQQEGASMEETAAYAEALVPKLCHWFTVDDLVYLKRGGRVSPAVAFVGTVLGIKPVLHVDNEGHLISKSKARGRKAALGALLQKYDELAVDKKGVVFICNADCSDDASYLKTELETKYGAKVELITDIGPVIGAHAGPGTIAVFFIGTER
ncbi:MAG: DegV family protein [Clostridia bacterium]|nr:DegV family protein [Clostridia bacterium]